MLQVILSWWAYYEFWAVNGKLVCESPDKELKGGDETGGSKHDFMETISF